MFIINERISIAPAEFQLTYSRSPGPGGQNVNKVNSKVTLRWNVQQTTALTDAIRQRLLRHYGNRVNSEGELILTSHRYRDQGRNVADVMQKLRELILAVAVTPKPRKKTRRTASSNRKRLDAKRRKSETKSGRKSVRLDS